MAEFLVDAVHGALTLDVQETVELGIDSLLSLGKLGQVGGDARPDGLVGEVVLDGVRQHEVAVGQALHESRGTEAIGTVVAEVALANSKEAGDRGLQLVVHPDAAHRVVDGGVDHHGLVVLHAVDLVGEVAGIDVGDLFVHIKEVAVALLHGVEAEAVDGLGEVEEHSQAGVVHAEALVAALLGSTTGHVTGHEVTEGGIAALQIVVAVFFGNLPALQRAFLQLLGVFQLLGNPDAAVVTQ